MTCGGDGYGARAESVEAPIRRGLVSLLRYWPVSNDKISLEYKMKRFLEGTLLPSDEAHTYWNGTFSAAQQAQFLLHCNRASTKDLFDSDLPAGDENGSLNRYLAFDQRYYLADDILQKADRMSVSHSLEVRLAFLDHLIVDVAAPFPEGMKIDGRQHKEVLHRLM